MIKEIQELSEEFKRSVIKEVNYGAITKEAARRLYGIKGKSSILNWQRNDERYGKCSLNLHFDPLPLKTNKPVQPDTAHEELKARIKVLERQLENEQLRAEAYSRMIDNQLEALAEKGNQSLAWSEQEYELLAQRFTEGRQDY